MCQASGYLFQIVGFVLALGSCCWWSISGHLQDPARESAGAAGIVEMIRTAGPGRIWSMLTVCVSFVGGMAAVAVGMGLQHERPRSGIAALAVTTPAALFFWAYLGASVFWLETSVAWMLTIAVMAVVWSAGFLLAGASADRLRRFPPETTPERAWTRDDEDDLRRGASPRSPDETSR